MLWLGRNLLRPGSILPKVRQSLRKLSTPAMNSETLAPKAPRAVGYWLLGCSGMTFAMVTLGGVTRLTESGLAMTDWKPLGRRPPKTLEEWQAEFDKYKESPEFQMKNQEISLEEFKKIWHMEYGHRMFGRAIGAAFYIPAAFFWYKGYLTKGLKIRTIAMGALLAGQGLLGWYMVKSGLDHKNFQGPSDVPRVSQYRLAAHLSTAMIFYSLIWWNALDILSPVTRSANLTTAINPFRRLAMGVKAMVFLTAVSGAFVAGLDAGLVYNSFPLMAGKVIPDDIMALEPKSKNFTENPTTVQFQHRILGTLTLAIITLTALRSRRVSLPPRARKAVKALTFMGYAQVGLGIATLLTYVPTWLAASHQAGAMLTLSSSLWLSHELKLLKVIKSMPK